MMFEWLIANYDTVLTWVGGAVVLNGIRKVYTNPRIKYLSHTDIAGKGTLVTIMRQQQLPPWSNVQETWLLKAVKKYEDDGYYWGRSVRKIANAIREFDGKEASEGLSKQIETCVVFAEAREEETRLLLNQQNV